MSRRHRLIAALIIPIVGIAALIVRGELRTSGDRVWHVAVEGYDPRDLLSGQYLRYRYRWHGRDAEDATPCGPDTRDCCLCLSGAQPGEAVTPTVGGIDCASPELRAGCDDVVVHEHVAGPQRFYIDERYATAAEDALRDGVQAAIELVVTPDGDVAVRELMLDGVPWREVLVPRDAAP